MGDSGLEKGGFSKLNLRKVRRRPGEEGRTRTLKALEGLKGGLRRGASQIRLEGELEKRLEGGLEKGLQGELEKRDLELSKGLQEVLERLKRRRAWAGGGLRGS